MTRLRNIAAALLPVVCAGQAVAQAPLLSPVLTVQESGSSVLFQAVSISAANPDVAWISGHHGTYAVTTNGGTTWTASVVPGRDSAEWRDVHAIDTRRAWLMSAGTGAKSTIVQTTDGGKKWTTVFANRDTAAFYDCMAFFDDRRAFAFSDAVNGRMPVVRTGNGTQWSVGALPAQDDEGGFAASGSCAQATPLGEAWIGTGNGAKPRVLHTTDAGRNWSAVEVPLVAGNGAGITALAFRDRKRGVAVGGAIGGNATGPRVARTADGGMTWTVTAEPPMQGALYGAAYAIRNGKAMLVVVGPGGAAWSADDGDTWAMLDAAPYWSVGFGWSGTGWLVGPKGRVVRIDWR